MLTFALLVAAFICLVILPCMVAALPLWRRERPGGPAPSAPAVLVQRLA